MEVEYQVFSFRLATDPCYSLLKVGEEAGNRMTY
jgi:hypothetical protein